MSYTTIPVFYCKVCKKLVSIVYLADTGGVCKECHSREVEYRRPSDLWEQKWNPSRRYIRWKK